MIKIRCLFLVSSDSRNPSELAGAPWALSRVQVPILVLCNIFLLKSYLVFQLNRLGTGRLNDGYKANK